MEALQSTISTLYDIDNIPLTCIEALNKEGFDENLIRSFTYEDWKELVVDKVIPLPRSILFKIKSVLEGSGRESLHLEVRNACTPSVLKLFHTDGNIGKGEVELLGSFTLLTKDGIGMTALHCVHFDDKIAEKSLHVNVQGNNHNLKHLVSYPYHDISLYKIQNLQGAVPYLKLGATTMIHPGKGIWLVSFSSNDSQEDPRDIEGPDFNEGRILKCNDTMIKGQYVSFPGCSGGAVINADGLLLGIHTGKDYYEDHSRFKPNSEEDFITDVAIRGLQLASPSNNKFEGAKVEELAEFAAYNIAHKDSLGLLVPVGVIKMKLSEEGIIGKRKVHTYPQRRTKARKL